MVHGVTACLTLIPWQCGKSLVMRAITVVSTLHSCRAYVDRAHAVGSVAAEQKLGKTPICRQRQFSLLFLKILVLSALDLEFLSYLGHKLSIASPWVDEHTTFLFQHLSTWIQRIKFGAIARYLCWRRSGPAVISALFLSFVFNPWAIYTLKC